MRASIFSRLAVGNDTKSKTKLRPLHTTATNETTNDCAVLPVIAQWART